MTRWLSFENANRASWGILALLALSAVVFVVLLVGTRGVTVVQGTLGRSGADAGVPIEATATSGPVVRTNGVVEQVEGGAFILRDGDGGELRVLIRSRAAITAVSIANGSEALRPGDVILVGPLTELQDNTLGVNSVAVLPQPGPPPDDGCGRFGTVTAVSPTRLVYEGGCGEQFVPLTQNTRVTRFVPAGAEALQPGRQVTVSAERLADGTLAAVAVQVAEP